MNKEKKDDDYKINNYKCKYCGFEFKQKVRKIGSNKKNTGSDQVKCGVCGNFLKTWSDAI